MAEDLPPGTPEVDDPLLVADLIRLLSIKGAIGRLPLADIVIPTVSLGDVVQGIVEVRLPAFRSTDVFSAGLLQAPAVGIVLADTTALPEGVYDVQLALFASGSINRADFEVQHRDAANAASLMAFSVAHGAGEGAPLMQSLAFGYEIGLNERLRAVVTGTMSALREIAITIFARLRT